MGRSAILLAAAMLCHAEDQTAAVRDAVAAMQRGDFPAAEKTLRAEVRTHPDEAWAVSLLGVALDNQKKMPEADEFHRRAVALSPHSAEILNNYGTHLWNSNQYDKAETAFASALAAAPAYFNVLFNLGVMATYTGHYDRAREVLEAALKQQPANVDVLYRLAFADEASRHWEDAVMRLAQAEKLDPRRADVQKLLALTTTELGALDDAEAAWSRYLKLQPNDDVASRELAFTSAKMGKLDQGIAGLEKFLAAHPDDAAGHYELGVIERSVDMTQALAHLDKALELNPDYVAAHAARGSLYYQEGKPELAVKDLEFAALKQPDDPANLDRLGQAYQALDRTADALRVLRKAAALAPGDSKTLLHFARALADAGLIDESKVQMDRFRQLGPEQTQGVPAGLVEYLSLTPAQRHAEYLARVEKSVRDHPGDPAAQVTYLKLMLDGGNTDQAAIAAQRIIALKPDAAVLADAGRALLAAHRYALAKDVLQRAGADVELDLAIATFHVSGKLEDTAAAFDLVRRAPPKQPDLYRQAAAFLIGKGRAAEALRWMDEAARVLPDDRETLLMQATTLEFARQPGDAAHLLDEIQSRWPEWPPVWLARGIILRTHKQDDEARKAIDTAVTLGARRPEAFDPASLTRFFEGSLLK